MEKYLTIDIGSTTFRYAVITEELDFLKEGRMNCGSKVKSMIFDPIKELSDSLGDEIDGITITMPGVIDRHTGFAYSGGMYYWVRDFDYAGELSAYTGKPVAIINDAKAAALAELGYGNLKHVKNGIMLMVLNTGIGGAVVIDGKMYDGSHFASGEVSYMKGDYLNRENGQDMFALSCSLSGLSREVEKTSGKKDLNMLRIFMKINDGDEDVLRGVENYCDHLASYIYNVQCVLDAERIVLGGGITEEPLMLALIQKAVNKAFDEDKYGNVPKPEMKGCCFHQHARMYGAVYNYREVMGKLK